MKIYRTIIDVFAERLEIPRLSQPEQMSVEESQAPEEEAIQETDLDESILFSDSGSSTSDENIQAAVEVEEFPVQLENSDKDV